MHSTNTGKPIASRIEIKKERLFMSEAFYLMISQPESELTFIARYILFNGKPNFKGQMGAWLLDKRNQIDFIYFSEYFDDDVTISADKLCLKIGQCSVDPSQFCGSVHYNNHTLTWSFSRDQINPLGIDRLPSIIAKMEGTGFQSPDCKGNVTGTIEFDSQKYLFNNYPASTGHYFGKKKKISWMWANCVQFNEDKSALLEVITVDRAPFLPSLPFLSLYWQGQFFNCQGIYNALFSYKETEKKLTAWQFSFLTNGYQFKVSIETNPKDMIVHTHPINETERLYTAITYCANMTILIYKKNQLIAKLSCDNGASFEYSRPQDFIEVTRHYPTPNSTQRKYHDGC